MQDKTPNQKRIAMIIAFQDFRDEEYFIPKGVFEKEEIEVITFSSKKGDALGSYGGVIKISQTLEDLKPEDFDGVIFVGGPGAHKYIENETCWDIAKQTLEKEKVLGAICIAPAILARSGVLEEKKACVWSNSLNKEGIKMLKEEDVEIIEEPVVVDGSIVTANGPKAARDFAKTIAEKLEG